MAKLSARGRTVTYTAVREYTQDQLQAAHVRRYPDKPDELSLTKWERVTRRLMSDGSVLEKHDVQFQPDWLDKVGRKHSYGWKLTGTLKQGLTPDDWAAAYRAPRKTTGKPSPWLVTAGGERPVVLSRRKIQQAIESGEHLGFCQSCGATAHNVEPDACGYPCASCGRPDVYGAEEIMIGMM